MQGLRLMQINDVQTEAAGLLDYINRDVQVLRDVSKGSDAYTYECLKDGKKFFRKIALAVTGGIDKLKQQVDWLLVHETLPVPKVLGWECNEDYCTYDMTAGKNCIAMFDYIRGTDGVSAWSYLESILGNLENQLFIEDKEQCERAQLREYIDTKIFKNVNYITEKGGQYINKLLTYPVLIINGKKYKNFNYFFCGEKKFNEIFFYEIFKSDPYSDIHGDFTIENIIYSSDGVYVIDPNLGNIHDSHFLDYAKLLQSLHGKYEYLQTVNDVNIQNNNIEFLINPHPSFNYISNEFERYLAGKHTENQLKSIYLHEIVHWLRLLTYKIRKDEKRAVIYFAQLVKLLNELNEGLLYEK